MMNRLHILIILAVFTLMFGCNEAEHADGIDSEKWNKNAYNLAGQLLDADTSLLNVMGILPVGDYLFLKQKTRKHEYSIYQRKGDSLVFVEHFLRKGNGPSEVNSVRLYNFPEFESLVAVAFNT
ncbi:MAG: hypothetical protein LBV41_13265, partial [Cytophagaceae bacterium]|nr:hypothetical protein [Cytophagaceae bacterium]